MIEVVSTVPRVPEKEPKYPFWKMEIGDSFAVRLTDRGLVSSAATSYRAKNPSFRWESRREGVMVRFWRVA